ncbi:MAG: adenylate/guanylate cyclase domain-containing protein [Solirubrobacteraceae bacterium]
MPEMRTCVACAVENPGGARFCMACGAELERDCAECGSAVPAGARFCPSCGTAVDGATATAAAPAPVATTPPRSTLGEERRTVTIVFADLSGYTAAAERLDPETLKALVDRCMMRLTEEVDRFAGRVDKYIGDAVMAVFGAPIAHEDDAERAVRAAAGMQAAMGELNQRLKLQYGVEFSLRVGVNTGEVLAGRMGETYTVIGDAVNVASRLQHAASPGNVTVGERTRRATSAVVQYERLAELTLKGKAEPVPAWRLVQVAAERAAGLRPSDRGAPLVGRDEELAWLEKLYARVARAGAPHLVTVFGSAGIGKTRLLYEFERSLAGRTPATALRRGRCLPFGSSVVYWPLSEMLRGECGIVDGDPAEDAWAKLSNRIGPLLAKGGADEESVRRLTLLARALGIEAPGEAASASDDAQSARESLFGAARACLEALAQEGPLVIAWEDIHWADEGMLDLIEYLSQWLRAPVLQVCLAREELLERRPSWGASRRTSASMFLEPLDAEETRELIASLLPGPSAESDVLDALAERSGGNPLFAEEMVQLLSEDGTARAAELPDTVQALLAARLDSLGPLERQLVAQAAVVGQTFWQGALASVAQGEKGDLELALATLREKDIIVPGESVRSGEERELVFKHVLIRDVAYSMLPKAVRARKHFEVGELIEGRAGERGEEVAALLAEHFGRAAALGAEVRLGAEELERYREKAVRFAEAAGDAASALYSNEEALSHYANAGELTGDLMRQTRIREKQADVALRLGRAAQAIELWQRGLEHHSELGDLEHVAELHRKIGAALAHKGERVPAIQHHQQGINLIKDAPPSLTLVRLYEEVAWLYMQVGDNMLAIYAAEKALRLAERLGAVQAASRAHGIFGRVFGRIGDTAKARENLERAIALAKDSGEGETVLATIALGHHLEHAEGDYEAAERSFTEALTLAQRIGDVPFQIELHASLAQLAFYRCDWEHVVRFSDISAELAGREGLIGKQCLPYTLRGLLRWREGEWDESMQLFRRAHELADRVGWSEVAFGALFGLAVTQRDSGKLAEAEATLIRAGEICDRAGLIGESIQTAAAHALLLTLTGDHAAAAQAAATAAALADRAQYPVGKAAALEARGITGEPPDALELLRGSRDMWQRLGRPLDAARCELLLGRRLRDCDPPAAPEVLAAAAVAYDGLGVGHRAELARELAAAG